MFLHRVSSYMLSRNADGDNNGLVSVVFKLKSVSIMSCLLFCKTSGSDWRAQPDDVCVEGLGSCNTFCALVLACLEL